MRFLLLLALASLSACGPKDPGAADDATAAADGEDEPAVKPRALVTVGTVQTDTLSDVLRLSAVSAYAAKDALRATTTGYVLAPTPVVGQRVRGPNGVHHPNQGIENPAPRPAHRRPAPEIQRHHPD